MVVWPAHVPPEAGFRYVHAVKRGLTHERIGVAEDDGYIAHAVSPRRSSDEESLANGHER